MFSKIKWEKENISKGEVIISVHPAQTFPPQKACMFIFEYLLISECVLSTHQATSLGEMKSKMYNTICTK